MSTSNSGGKSSKLLQHVGARIKITIADSRSLVGTFMAFDKHMNMVLSDTSEFRRTKGKKNEAGIVVDREERRKLGLVILRGENIVSITVEGPGPNSAATRKAPGGPGAAAGAGRGAAIAPPPAMGGVPMMGLGAAPAFGVNGGGGFMAPPMGRGRGF